MVSWPLAKTFMKSAVEKMLNLPPIRANRFRMPFRECEGLRISFFFCLHALIRP